MSAMRLSNIQDERDVACPKARPDLDVMLVRSFSTSSRPALRAAASGGRPRRQRHDGHLGELAYWRANAARASVARSTNASPLTSMNRRLMVPPTNGQGASPA